MKVFWRLIRTSNNFRDVKKLEQFSIFSFVIPNVDFPASLDIINHQTWCLDANTDFNIKRVDAAQHMWQ